MKVIFLVLMCVVFAFTPIGIKALFRKTDVLSRKMRNVLAPATLSVVAHCVMIFTAEPLTALVSHAVYFASATWISVFVFDFCLLYAESRAGRNLLRFVVMPLALIDTAALAANCFFPFMFTLHTVTYSSHEFLRYVPSIFFLLHVLFDDALLVCCFVMLFRKMLREPPSLRIKYYSLLTFLFLITFSNIIYVLFEFPFNFSIIVYAFCFVAAYHILMKIVPNMLIQKTLSLITDGLRSGIVLLDTERTCIYMNACAEEILGCKKDTVLSQELFVSFEEAKKMASTGVQFSREFDCSSDSKRLVLKISEFFITEAEALLGSYYLVEDITESKNQVHEEKILRTRDKLTGLFNQDYFFERVAHRLKFDRFTPYYLVITDIVNFKLINDLHGNRFGDTILIRMAESIRTQAAPDDIYGRLYNDHFVMLVPKRRFNEEAFVSAIKSKMEYLSSFSYNLVSHMGVYEVDDLTIPVSVMCDRAFLALKSIKSDYKSAVAYYNDGLRLEVLQMQTLMNELPLALKYGQVVMYLQPQVRASGAVVGAEALVRWHHPSRGVIPPGEFIEIIEKINIISDVDRYVWECSCAKLADWKARGRDDLTISVNISAKDFFTMDLYETFMGLVEKYGISPKNLNLEITESAIIFDLDRQMKLLGRLRAAGFVVEMDDFGSGYSSLNMLKDISVDVLKIDMEFLKNSKENERSRIILEKIIMLAKELGMKVVTEGVESGEQIDFLAAAGSDLFQGFYFSPPIPVQDFEDLYFKREGKSHD